MSWIVSNGPVCGGTRKGTCKGRTWTYSFSHMGAAVCAACGSTEGPLRLREKGTVLPVPEDGFEARKMHQGFRVFNGEGDE